MCICLMLNTTQWAHCCNFCFKENFAPVDDITNIQESRKEKGDTCSQIDGSNSQSKATGMAVQHCSLCVSTLNAKGK